MTVIRTTATNFGISPRWLMGALAATLCVAAGCDAPERESFELERQPDDEALRSGTNSGGWGSIRLNTPQFLKYRLGDVLRDSSSFTPPDEPELSYSLTRVELDLENPFHVASNNPIEVVRGRLKLDNLELPEELLLGARLVYEMTLPNEDPIEVGATVTGVMIAQGPTGEIPLVNLEWDHSVWNQYVKYPQHNDPDYPDQDEQLCPPPLPGDDPNLWGVEQAKPLISNNGVRPNAFDLATAAVLYNDLYIDTTSGHVSHEDVFMTIACVSGAAGKAALWGFPGWVEEDPDTGLGRHQQLQNAMSMIRFDVCMNGDANTLEGTEVQIRDRYVGSFDVAGDTEAVWGLDGRAVCIGTPRLEGGTPLPMSCGGADIPTCNSTHEAMLDAGTAFAWTKRPTLSAPPAGACETTSPTPGCAEEPAIEACVCDADPYCCHTAWDSICVNEVTSLACDDNVPYPDACTAQPYPSPGTSNSWVEQCVCDADSYCCTTSWDWICANEVESLGCGVCS